MSGLLVKTNVRYLTEVFEEREGANLLEATTRRHWMLNFNVIPIFSVENNNTRQFLDVWRRAAALQKPIYSSDFDFIHTSSPRTGIGMQVGHWDKEGTDRTFVKLDRLAYSIEWARWNDVPAPLIMASYGLPAVLASGMSPITDELMQQSKFDGALLERVFANPRP